MHQKEGLRSPVPGRRKMPINPDPIIQLYDCDSVVLLDAFVRGEHRIEIRMHLDPAIRDRARCAPFRALAIECVVLQVSELAEFDGFITILRIAAFHLIGPTMTRVRTPRTIATEATIINAISIIFQPSFSSHVTFNLHGGYVHFFTIRTI